MAEPVWDAACVWGGMLWPDQAGWLVSWLVITGEYFPKRAIIFFRNMSRRIITIAAAHPTTIPAMAPPEISLLESLDPLVDVGLGLELVRVAWCWVVVSKSPRKKTHLVSFRSKKRSEEYWRLTCCGRYRYGSGHLRRCSGGSETSWETPINAVGAPSN